MRYPWDDLADAFEAFRAAERAGDVIGICDAEDAVAAAERQLALLGLLLFRRAAESEETAPHLLRTLDRIPPTAPALDAIDGSAKGLRRTQEWLACEVKRLQAENWELALELARLKLRIEQIEGCADAVAPADHRTDRQGGRGDPGQCRTEGDRDEISPVAVVEEG